MWNSLVFSYPFLSCSRVSLSHSYESQAYSIISLAGLFIALCPVLSFSLSLFFKHAHTSTLSVLLPFVSSLSLALSLTSSLSFVLFLSVSLFLSLSCSLSFFVSKSRRLSLSRSLSLSLCQSLSEFLFFFLSLLKRSTSEFLFYLC